METADTVTAALLGGERHGVRLGRCDRRRAGRRRRRRGHDTATYNGTADDDAIGIARNGTHRRGVRHRRADVQRGAVESLLVKGDNGNDTLDGINGIGT